MGHGNDLVHRGLLPLRIFQLGNETTPQESQSRAPYAPTRRTICKAMKVKTVGRDTQKEKPSYIAGWNEKQDCQY